MEDSEGAKYNIQLDGNVTKDKVLKIIELMDLINTGEEKETVNLNSVGGKIWNVLDIHFPMGKFTSSEIQEKYEDEYNEPVKLSVISVPGVKIAVNIVNKPVLTPMFPLQA